MKTCPGYTDYMVLNRMHVYFTNIPLVLYLCFPPLPPPENENRVYKHRIQRPPINGIIFIHQEQNTFDLTFEYWNT